MVKDWNKKHWGATCKFFLIINKKDYRSKYILSDFIQRYEASLNDSRNTSSWIGKVVAHCWKGTRLCMRFNIFQVCIRPRALIWWFILVLKLCSQISEFLIADDNFRQQEIAHVTFCIPLHLTGGHHLILPPIAFFMHLFHSSILCL